MTRFTNYSPQAESVIDRMYNNSGSAMAAGDVVHISGWNVGQTLQEITLADADTAASMPAIGVCAEAISNNTAGNVVISGVVNNIDTSSFSTADELYVSTTAGSFTTTKPVGNDEIQKVAICLRSHASLGSVQVVGAGRSNDIPNFTAADKFWYGGTAGVATEGDLTSAARDELAAMAAPQSNANATFTLGASDKRRLTLCTNASAKTITVPTGQTAGDWYWLQNTGAGLLSLTTTGLTLNGSAPPTTATQNKGVFIIYTATSTISVFVGGAP